MLTSSMQTMVRQSEETILSERKAFLEEQRKHDEQLEERLAGAQARTEDMVQALLKTQRRDSMVRENAEHLNEIQEGLRSMKTDIRRRATSSTGSLSPSRHRYSVSHLPRAEEVMSMCVSYDSVLTSCLYRF